MYFDDDVPRRLDRPNTNRPPRDLSRTDMVLAALAGLVAGVAGTFLGLVAFDTVQTNNDLRRAYTEGYNFGESGAANSERQCSVAAAALYPDGMGEHIVYQNGCEAGADGEPPTDLDTVVETQTS